MDLDRYVATHAASWDRLRALSRAASRSPKGLDPVETEALLQLYQRVSGHLSHVQRAYADPDLEDRLSVLVADAGGVIYRSRPRPGAALARFVNRSFPLAVWRMRWHVVVAAAALLVPALIVGAWLATSDAALDAAAPEAVRAAYIGEQFESYYSSAPAGQFATEVTVNNIQVAITAFALGILAGVGTLGILVFNGANIGFAGGLFHAAGVGGRFWGLILPHGLLELTAVVLAGAAGLRLGWAVVDPGERTRAEAVTAAGRESMVVVLGLVAVFVGAGLIEGFVTGSSLPTVLRIGTGAAVWAAFVAHVAVRGRAAAAEADRAESQSRPVALTSR